MATALTSIDPTLKHDMTRRRTVLSGLGLILAAAPAFGQAQATATPVEIWKAPECGCCRGWITHLERNGFVAAQIHNEGNTAARKSLGMPLAFGSCHSARVGGYAIEGHVPAREIRRLLKERPQAVGLAVPAMPLGSPGMDGPDFDNQTQPYDVLLVLKDGSTRVYQSYFR